MKNITYKNNLNRMLYIELNIFKKLIKINEQEEGRRR